MSRAAGLVGDFDKGLPLAYYTGSRRARLWFDCKGLRSRVLLISLSLASDIMAFAYEEAPGISVFISAPIAVRKVTGIFCVVWMRAIRLSLS